jgi:hypothetical protein
MLMKRGESRDDCDADVGGGMAVKSEKGWRGKSGKDEAENDDCCSVGPELKAGREVAEDTEALEDTADKVAAETKKNADAAPAAPFAFSLPLPAPQSVLPPVSPPASYPPPPASPLFPPASPLFPPFCS